MKAEERVKAAFAKIGKEFNFNRVDANICAFCDFKLKWTRSYDWIEMQVSDYISTAPDEVLEDLARSVFEKIRGEHHKAYPDSVVEFITSQVFIDRNQPRYIRRAIGSYIEGRDFDSDKAIRESYQRLVDKGLISPIENLKLIAIPDGSRKCRPIASTAFRVVAIPESYTELETDALDLQMFSMLIGVEIGFEKTVNTPDVVREEKSRRLAEYPDFENLTNKIRDQLGNTF